jgi:plasmid stabilization system protein ParE
MAFQIIWTENARNDLKKIIDYLLAEWSLDVAENFIEKLDQSLEMLTIAPYMGRSSDKIGGVRQILITKHNKLYYQVIDEDIFLLDFFDTRQDDDKSTY